MNNVAVITGSTRGIGEAIAYRLASMGFNLILGARSELELLGQKQLLERQFKVKVDVLRVDLSIEEDALEFANFIQDKATDIAVLVNNVGSYTIDSIETVSTANLATQFNTNFYSSFWITQQLILRFKAQKNGHIFTIGSVVNNSPRAAAMSYTISKNAQHSYFKMLFEELRAFNIKVSIINPGSVNTSSWRGIEAPKETFVQPEDIASTIASILELSEHCNVSELTVNPLDKNY